MTLSKFELISPSPYGFDKVGHIKAVRLRDIDELPQKNNTYDIYIQMLRITRHEMFGVLGITPEDADTLIDNARKDGINLTVYDLICMFQELTSQYILVLDFFFVENVAFLSNYNKFVTYQETDENGNIIPTGFIDRNNFTDVCNVILQRCGISHQVNRKEEQKFKNEKARKIWEKMYNSPDVKTQSDIDDAKNYELGNIVSVLPAHCSGLNMLNIWDMTLYNVYDQFRIARQDAVYKITSTSTAVWGNKDNKFDFDSWFKIHNSENHTA